MDNHHDWEFIQKHTMRTKRVHTPILLLRNTDSGEQLTSFLYTTNPSFSPFPRSFTFIDAQKTSTSTLAKSWTSEASLSPPLAQFLDLIIIFGSVSPALLEFVAAHNMEIMFQNLKWRYLGKWTRNKKLPESHMVSYQPGTWWMPASWFWRCNLYGSEVIVLSEYLPQPFPFSSSPLSAPSQFQSTPEEDLIQSFLGISLLHLPLNPMQIKGNTNCYWPMITNTSEEK